jgi:hypothetical protein
MGKVWILDTDTKGTGAQMVPLDKVEKKAETKLRVATVRLTPSPESGAPEPEEAPTPRRFKVVDVMSERVLAEGADARGTLDALAGVRSVVDVSIYEWQEQAAKWRALTLSERRAFLALRDRR